MPWLPNQGCFSSSDSQCHACRVHAKQRGPVEIRRGGSMRGRQQHLNVRKHCYPMPIVEEKIARFTTTYRVVVFCGSVALIAVSAYLLDIKGYHQMLQAIQDGAIFNVTENALKLGLLSLLMVGVAVTQLSDMLRPQDILRLTAGAIHDRRLTRGPIPWGQIQRVILYRRGWQWVAQIDLKPLTVGNPDYLALGPILIHAFNRQCARWLKRPELIVRLGGMTVPSAELFRLLQDHCKGEPD